MAEYLHPGVYIEETSYRSPPFEGVSTSTAGLVGRTRKGPEGRPTLVTSFTEFARTFGNPFPILAATPPQLGDYLGHAVRAFFDNGGKRAYIVRALAKDALTATSDVARGVAYRLPGTTTVRGPTMSIPLDTVRGIDVGSSLDVYTRASNGTLAPKLSVSVAAVDPQRNVVTLGGTGIAAGIQLAPGSTVIYPGGTTLPRPANGPTFSAKSRGADGNSISVQVRPADGNAVRIVAQRFFRGFPQVAAFTGSGPAAGAPQTFAASTLGIAAIGDTLAFDGANAEVATITDVGPTPFASIAATITGAGGTASAPAVVTLVQRGGTTLATPIPLYTLAGAEQVVASGSTVSLPYGALPLVQAGDTIAAGGVTFTLSASPDFSAAGNTVTVGALASPHPVTTVTIKDTGDLDAGAFIKRLIVSDATGLVDLAVPPQKIAITNGTASVTADVLLVDGAKNTIVVKGTSAIPNDWTSFELLQVAGASDAVTVATTAGFYTGAIVELFDGKTGDYFHVKAIDPGSRQITLDQTPTAITVDADPAKRNAVLRVLELDVLVYEGGTLVETFAGLSWNPDPATDAMQRWFLDRINDADNGSQLVSVAWPALPLLFDPTTQPYTPDGFPYALGQTQTGTDGTTIADTDLIGRDDGPGHRTGIEALKEKTDIALVAVPGVTLETVQQALLTHCENLRYRFAILDGKLNQSDLSQVEAHRGNYESHYGGYYVPWLKTLDLDTGRTMLSPPSGYVLGICARVDNERGVHKAPANEVVRNVLDVELPFTDGEQDVLNPQGINVIRELEGRGIRVWGARTTTSDTEWKYVNVRRLFIFLEHSIDNNTKWVVFEPNNEALWERVKESIESFLFGVWKTGALMGTKPDEAYFVRCDRTTMTQDDIDNGRLICLIGVAPTYPAEFVIFRIGQFTASTNQA